MADRLGEQARGADKWACPGSGIPGSGIMDPGARTLDAQDPNHLYINLNSGELTLNTFWVTFCQNNEIAQCHPTVSLVPTLWPKHTRDGLHPKSKYWLSKHVLCFILQPSSVHRCTLHASFWECISLSLSLYIYIYIATSNPSPIVSEVPAFEIEQNSISNPDLAV